MLDRKPLSDTRNDDSATVASRHILKFCVMREKYHILLSKTLSQLYVPDSSLSKNDNMLHIIPLSVKPMVEWERKILIQQDLQEACSTAGGR